MVNLFGYDNFRTYIRDYIDDRKREVHGFSLRAFAARCGFASHSFLVHVLQGEKNLRLDSIERLLIAMEIHGREASYFRALVLYNQSGTASDRERYLKELNHLRAGSSYARVREDQWAYYSKWYLPVLRELVVVTSWHGDFAKLGKMVRPAITAKEASEGVDLLLRIGLIKRITGARFALQDQVVSAEGVPGVVFRSVRSEYMLRALEAAETLPKEDRHASYAVLGTSYAAFERINEKMNELRQDILSAYADSEPVECVFAVNLQAFPVSVSIVPKRDASKGSV
jgi:uncharacterized protein (TIGR02147 family)